MVIFNHFSTHVHLKMCFEANSFSISEFKLKLISAMRFC